MLHYSLRRLMIGAGMLVALSMLIFLLLRLTPGDPIDAYIDPNIPMSPEQLADTAQPARARPALAGAISGLAAARP